MDTGLKKGLFIFVVAPVLAGLILFLSQRTIESFVDPDNLALEAIVYYPGFVIPDDFNTFLAPSHTVEVQSLDGAPTPLGSPIRSEVAKRRMALSFITIRNSGNRPLTNLNIEIQNQDSDGNSSEVFTVYNVNNPRNDIGNVQITLENNIVKVHYDLLGVKDTHGLWLLLDASGDILVLTRNPSITLNQWDEDLLESPITSAYFLGLKIENLLLLFVGFVIGAGSALALILRRLLVRKNIGWRDLIMRREDNA